jgi:hypothetical protein
MKQALILQEKKIRNQSLLITSGCIIALLLITNFWLASRAYLPPVIAEEYEIVGTIDFGNNVEGSMEVNNFQAPAPNPTPGEKRVNTETSSPIADQPNDPVITGTEPTEVVSSPTTPTRKRKDWSLPGGGSNDGEGNQVGNSGTPDAKELNPNGGGYAFGEGEEGLQGRKLISSVMPKYDVQEDAKITYEIVISPEGKVKEVIPKTLTTSARLTLAAKEALRQWKFDDISKRPGAKDKRLKVSITFRLK